MSDWFSITFEQIIGIFLSAFLIYAGLLLIIRMNGLRSFSKMSAHDFAVTVAIGSILATACIAKEPSILQALFGIGSLLLVQTLYSVWRRKRTQSFLENDPIMLMRDGEILDNNLAKAKITLNDLRGKLREANVLQLSEVRAVVLEATGDVSVLHGDVNVEDFLLEDVRS